MKDYQYDMTFIVNVNFKIYLETRTLDQTYQFSQCDQSFSQKDNLKIHLRNKMGRDLINAANVIKAFLLIAASKAILGHILVRSYQCN